MTVTWETWNGILKGCRGDNSDVTLEMLIDRNDRTGSKAFRGSCDDNQKYWIKPPNNPQGEFVPITEQIVGRVAKLIGAATCDVKTVKIPHQLSGVEFTKNLKLQAGIAHGSLNIDSVVEERSITHRDKDDNKKRHATLFALYDWCWGDDVQALYQITQEHKCYSHDHGWYLPPNGPTWNIQKLRDCVNISHELNAPIDGIDSGMVNDVINNLQSVTRNKLIDVLSCIPTSWKVSDEELEKVGWFLENRVTGVIDRLKQKFGVLI